MKNMAKGKLKIENYKYGDFHLIIPPYKKNLGTKTTIIEIQDISIENFYLSNGSILKCSFGDSSSNYIISPEKKFFINEEPMASISDVKSLVNICPFGMCSSMQNPTVASATSANNGVLKKMPCNPQIIGQWSNGVNYFLLSNEKVPCDKSKLNCAYSGVISVKEANQKFFGSEKIDFEKQQAKEEEEKTYKEIEITTIIKKNAS